MEREEKPRRWSTARFLGNAAQARGRTTAEQQSVLYRRLVVEDSRTMVQCDGNGTRHKRHIFGSIALTIRVQVLNMQNAQATQTARSANTPSVPDILNSYTAMFPRVNGLLSDFNQGSAATP